MIYLTLKYIYKIKCASFITRAFSDAFCVVLSSSCNDVLDFISIYLVYLIIKQKNIAHLKMHKSMKCVARCQ